MKVDDPGRTALQLMQEFHRTVTTVSVTAEQVERLLSAMDVAKATDPDDVIPRLIKQCAKKMSGLLSSVIISCLKRNKWPTLWKEARVVPAHKRNSKSEPSNYRPISLLSVMGKVLEKIVAEIIC